MNKLKKNESGFGLIESLLILVIVVLLGGAVFYVVNANKKVNNNDDGAAIAKSEEKTEDENKSDYTYELPDNWSEIACSQEDTENNPAYNLAFPNNDKAIDCEDRQDTVLIGLLPYEVDESTKCETLEEVNAQAEDNGKQSYISYKCEEIYVSDVRVLTYSHTQDEVYTEEKDDILGMKIYEFAGKKPLQISYYSSDTKGTLVYLSEVDSLAKSVKIN